MTSRMKSCVDHIKTSLDVDQWAMELVEQVFTEYDARFDKMIEIIDEIEHDNAHLAFIGDDNKFAGVLCHSREFRDRILALKEG